MNELIDPQKLAVNRDDKGRFLPGSCPNPGGKPKGAKDKAVAIKLAFFEVFDRIGGIDDLEKWVHESKRNKAEFYKHLLSILPKELQVEGEGVNQTKIVIIRAENNADKAQAVSG